jgi:DNA repair protein RadD
MALRDYQREAIDAVFDYWRAEAGHPLVDMATGVGKSITAATLINELITGWPDMRIMSIVHVVELVEGNFKELLGVNPFAPAGIFAASLGRRDAAAQIIFAQLQTVWNLAHIIGHIDVLVIDEVHLVPRDANTMYGKLISALLAINPDMKIVGLTATIYRLDSGRLDEGEDKLFDRVVYSYDIGRAIEDGWLSPLSSKGMATGFDLTGVGSLGGDYKKGALSAAVDKEEITREAVAEAIAYGKDRRTALFFCSGVDHAHHVRDEVRRHGRTCETIHGKTPAGERRDIIEAFKAGRIWGVSNDAILTTGTNIPGIDLIADLAPTKSTSRYVQKAGRGTRPVWPAGFNPDSATAEERRAAIARGPKPNCLYLDYARNVSYHGPVDQVQARTPGKGDGSAPVKQCPQDAGGCGELVHISIMTCPCCGHEFPPSEEVKITSRAADVPILSKAEAEWRTVTGRTFYFHPGKAGKPDTVKVSYLCGLTSINEWMCPAHTGYAKSKADRWWRAHGGTAPFPKTPLEWMERQNELMPTAEISVVPNDKYWNVKSHRVAAANDNVAVVAVAAANDNYVADGRAIGNASWEEMDDFVPF